MDASLSPIKWDDFIGQKLLKDRLQTHMQAALNQARPMEHVLLTGPPGFGKTTLASLIAITLTDPIEVVPLPITDTMLLRKLRNFEGGILFLDELHSASKSIQEMILPVIERGVVQDKKGREYGIPWLTVVAATTERNKIIPPLYDRFHIKPEFEDYSDEDMGLIVENMAKRLDVTLNNGDFITLGRAAGGVPRIAQDFIIAARDITITEDQPPEVDRILAFCRVDADGLSALHLKYLEALKSAGGLAGQKTLEHMMRLNADSIREVERLLVIRGYIEYTPKGRELTPEAEQKLRGERPPDKQYRQGVSQEEDHDG